MTKEATEDMEMYISQTCYRKGTAHLTLILTTLSASPSPQLQEEEIGREKCSSPKLRAFLPTLILYMWSVKWSLSFFIISFRDEPLAPSHISLEVGHRPNIEQLSFVQCLMGYWERRGPEDRLHRSGHTDPDVGSQAITPSQELICKILY